MDDLIGPLTAAEWCAFRQREDDDLLQCCGVTSEMRDAIFYLLRMGGERWVADGYFAEAWKAMQDHGLPDGEGGDLLRKLAAYYIGEPVAPEG